jgi:AcrR family transcriptional regulator
MKRRDEVAPGGRGSDVRSPPPNGHEIRSAETRARMLAAAIEVFGRVGYEAASTRELTRQGRTNLSAIPYHFGGKRELYLAAAEVIADYAGDRVGTLVVGLDDDAAGDVGQRLDAALRGFLRLMLEDSEPRAWTTFLARCASEDDAAFHLIYDRALAPLHTSLVRAVCALGGDSVDEEEIRLRVSSTMTALISFRLLRGIVLRGMDWKVLRSRDTRRIEGMVLDLVRSGFLSAGPVAFGPSERRAEHREEDERVGRAPLGRSRQRRPG